LPGGVIHHHHHHLATESVGSPSKGDELWYMRRGSNASASDAKNIEMRTMPTPTSDSAADSSKPISKNVLTLPVVATRDRKGSTASNASNFSDTSVNALLGPNKKFLDHNLMTRDRKNSSSSADSSASQVVSTIEMEKALALAIPTNSFYEKYQNSSALKALKALKYTMIGVLVFYIILAGIDIIAMATFYLWEFFGKNSASSFYPTLDIYPIVGLVISFILSSCMILFAVVNFIQILTFIASKTIISL